MRYSPTDIGLAVGAFVSFVFALVAIFRPQDVLPANDQAQITALIIAFVTSIAGLVVNRVGKHLAGVR